MEALLFCHCHRVAADKNEIRRYDYLTTSKTSHLFTLCHTEYETRILHFSLVSPGMTSFTFEQLSSYTRSNSNSNCAYTLFTGYTFLLFSLLFYPFFIRLLFESTSKVNFISIDVAIFPILSYFAFAMMSCHHFLSTYTQSLTHSLSLYFMPSILFTKSSNLCIRYRHTMLATVTKVQK